MAKDGESNPDESIGSGKASPPSKAAPVAGKSSAGPGKRSGKTTSKAAKTKVPGARRRDLVWWSVFGFFAACGAATLRFFYPRVLFEPKTRFIIGYPSEFGIGVSTRFQQSNRIWVVRDSSEIYVIYARCTHLGCTPDWKEAENKFKCPCHGSGFDTEGINFEGPAPKPLARVHVEVDGEGQIVVDTAKLYETDQWGESGASLPV